MIEDLLRETLRDPERAPRPWPDPAGRIRRAAGEARRRRLVTVAAAVAVAAGVVALPQLAPDRRTAPPADRPGGPVARHVASFGVAAEEVVPGDGVVYVRHGADLRAVDPGTGEIRATGRLREAPAVAGRTVLASSELWVANGRWVERYAASSLSGVGGSGYQGPVDDVATDGNRVWYADGDVLRHSAGPQTVALPGRAPTRLAYADGVLWARRQGDDAALLVRIDPAAMAVTGTATVPGGPRDAPLAAAGGRVYLATASVGDDFLTGGGVVAVDAATLAVGEPVEAAFARDLAYDDGSVWLLAIGGGLHRLDLRTLQPLGSPVETGPARDLAVADGVVWVAGERLRRYEPA